MAPSCSCGRSTSDAAAAPPTGTAAHTIRAVRPGCGRRPVAAGVAGRSARVLQVSAGIVLARLLKPEDFGLAALALVVTGFVNLAADLGLGSAIIQRREFTSRHLNVALTAALGLGILISSVIILAAPLIGSATNTPALVKPLRVLSLAFVTAGCATVAISALQRRLDFRRLFVVEVTSYSVGYALVAIAGAMAGLGVWSLVFGSLAQSLVLCLLSLGSAGAPVRPLLARRELRDLLGFGTRVSANQLVGFIGRNGDNLLVGRLLGAESLGLYSRAFNLMMMPINYVTSVLFTVLVPAYAEIQDQRARVGRGFLLSVQFASNRGTSSRSRHDHRGAPLDRGSLWRPVGSSCGAHAAFVPGCYLPEPFAPSQEPWSEHATASCRRCGFSAALPERCSRLRP